MSKTLAREIAEFLQSQNMGVFTTSDPSLRTIYVGNAPDTPAEYLLIVPAPSPDPHKYLDTRRPVIDFWYRSPSTALADDYMEQLFNTLHRRSNYQLQRWFVYFSRALGEVADLDRDTEGGKLLRLSIQFMCRNTDTIS